MIKGMGELPLNSINRFPRRRNKVLAIFALFSNLYQFHELLMMVLSQSTRTKLRGDARDKDKKNVVRCGMANSRNDSKQYII